MNKKIKFLFIYPNVGSQIGFNYGVTHLSSVLKKAGHEVYFIQLCEKIEPLPTKEQFLEKIKEISPDLIGFSVVTNQWEYTKKLAKWIKQEKTLKNIPLICGGIHATVSGEEVLNTDLFEYIFIGESEDAILEFVDKYSKKQDLSNIRNVGLKINGKIKINPVRPFPDLTKLPQKDYELLDFQKMIDAKGGWVGLMASRGCPFKCTYCFNHLMVSKYKKDLNCSFKQLNYIRYFTIDQMIKEIEYLLKNYKNIKMFIFDDDLFTFDRKFVIEFCKEYRKKFNIPFVANAHVNHFDEEIAHELAKSHCKIIKFGVESGSEKIRKKVLQRYMKNEKIKKAIQIGNKAGLHTSIFLMIGLPYETKEDLMETIYLTAESKPGRFRWTFFFPFPGTKACEISKQGNFIDYEKMKKLVNFTDESCLNFGEEQNLLLKKIGLVMPWFINAYSNLKVSKFYKEKIDWILSLDEKEWNKISPTLIEKDKEYSKKFSSQGLTHYAIKYNRFMGVISDYFLNED